MKILTEYEAEDFLEKQGFNIVSRSLALNLKEIKESAEKIGYPVVLKISSPLLVHKSEKNAVKLNVNKDNIEEAYKELDKIKVTKQGIIVQKYLPGKNIILGIKKDPTFGHIILLGIGGIYTEIIKDTSIKIIPIGKLDAENMIKELKSYEVLAGYRGEKVNLKLIEENLLKLSNLVEKHPEIKELDINPLVINEKKARVVDARILFE